MDLTAERPCGHQRDTWPIALSSGLPRRWSPALSDPVHPTLGSAGSRAVGLSLWGLFSALSSSCSVASAWPYTEAWLGHAVGWALPQRGTLMVAHRVRKARGRTGGRGVFQSYRDSPSSISVPFLYFAANHVFCQAVKCLKEGEAR